MLRPLPPPVPTPLSYHSQALDERRHSFDKPADVDVHAWRHCSRGSGSSSSRDSAVNKKRESFNLPPASVETLDLINKARQDLTAPLPRQQESQAQSQQHWQATPGSLRCASPRLPGPSQGVPSGHHTFSAPPSGRPVDELQAELEELRSERRQLIDWGEKLSQQVSVLEHEKATLETNVTAVTAAAAGTQKQLQDDLKQAMQRAADHHRQATASGAAASENEALRKQLAAYSVEVDTLRDENESLQKSHSEAQETVRQVTDECEDLRARVRDLERSDEDLRKRNEELLGNLEKIDKPGENRERDAQVAREREHSKALATALRSLRDSYSVLQEGFVAQTREFESFSQRVKEQQQDAEQQLSGATRQAERQQEVVAQLHRAFLELRGECHGHRERQQQLEHQARKAETCAAELANKQLDWHRERQDLKDNLVSETRQRREVEEEISRRDQAQRERNEKRQHRLDRNPALLRLERALERNIARDMYELHLGAVLEKVHERNCRREPRLVQVSAEEMVLRWSKDLQNVGRSCSSLDLYEVIRIHYGGMARACVLHTDVPPWLCFSLYTPRRSYDFCCPDEETVQRFVLGLSRLCDWASGTVATRRRFIALRGWCKLEDACFRQQMSLGQLFYEAITRIAEAPSQLGQLHSPAPPLPPSVSPPS